MSDAQKAAEAYVEVTDYIDNNNRRLAGNAFLAGAAWQGARYEQGMAKLQGRIDQLVIDLQGIAGLSNQREPNATHTKSWACIKPDGDGCDGNHAPEATVSKGESDG